MTVDRAHIGHETRYALRDGADVRCLLVFDTGEEGSNAAEWKILIPDPAGNADLYGTHQFLRPDAGQLTAWLAPIVGPDAAAELAAAADASPPPTSSWERPATG